MIEKIAGMAERMATSVGESRRGFCARVGQGALGVVGVLAGLLAFPSAARAETDCGDGWTCPNGAANDHCCFRGATLVACCPNGLRHLCTRSRVGTTGRSCHRRLEDAIAACGGDQNLVIVC